VDTDEGITGYGEVCCPVAPGYTPFFAAGVRAGTTEVADSLLGEDPTELTKINAVMDACLTGHDYAKSGIDIACWDILGKAANLPVSTLLGGRFGDSFPLYHPVGQDSPERMVERVAEYRSQGYKCFQLKVGGEPHTDIDRILSVAAELRSDETLVADANRGWLMHEAMEVISALSGTRVFIEQPCSSYEECLSVRRHCKQTFVLDESIQSLTDIVRAHNDAAADVINLKVAKLGGLTKVSKARDLCVGLGLPVFIDNAKGGDIIGAVMAHLAHSTPSRFLFATTDFHSYMKERIADGAPIKVNGRLAASRAPGLGIEPLGEVLKQPILDIRA
jgi:L-alanine-DL-glutamate epimerase-like enolase superfamily enzyme